MNIFDLERSLPHGFHDAQVSRLAIDYVGKTLDIELEVWVGDLDASPGPEREKMRPASLQVSGLIYCVIDPPDPRYPYAKEGSLSIDIAEIDFETAPALPTDIPTDSFSFRIWVSCWNAFVYVAGRDASLEWRG